MRLVSFLFAAIKIHIVFFGSQSVCRFFSTTTDHILLMAMLHSEQRQWQYRSRKIYLAAALQFLTSKVKTVRIHVQLEFAKVTIILSKHSFSSNSIVDLSLDPADLSFDEYLN